MKCSSIDNIKDVSKYRGGTRKRDVEEKEDEEEGCGKRERVSGHSIV